MIQDLKLQLAEVRRFLGEGFHSQAFQNLIQIAQPEADFSTQSKFISLLSKIDLSNLNLKKLRIAIVGTSTVDHIGDLLKLYLARDGYDAQIYIAPFGVLFPEILDGGSGLYEFRPDVVWIFSNYRDVMLADPNPSTTEPEVQAEAANSVQRFVDLWEAIKSRTNAAIIQNNFDLPADRPFGNFDGITLTGKIRRLRQINEVLASKVQSGVVILDMEHLSSCFGKRHWHDSRFWHHSKHAFSFDAAGEVASQGAKQIVAVYGQSKKCLVLDLDNTLWGGVIGDDGLHGIALGNGATGEAFVAFQEYVLELKRRGIILAVCSKNNDEVAREVFLKHPDMRLKIEDVSVFVANWDNKADNIGKIAKTLNIGLDAIVFVDDNPAERAVVRELLPMVLVPEISDDPASYIHALDRLACFETTAFSAEDGVRGEYYRANAERVILESQTSDLSSFLVSLDMTSEWGELDEFHLPRFVQLVNKSNQFNLTTIRYSEADITNKLADSTNRRCLYFKLKDKFGDNGLISSVILQKISDEEININTWVMSCRVLSRTMERFILERLADVGRGLGYQRLTASYVPTAKNKMVEKLYENLGFTFLREDGGATFWELDISQPLPKHSHITSDQRNSNLMSIRESGKIECRANSR